MRILQVVHGFPPREWTGTELVTLYLSEALRDRGHQVTVFTRTADAGASEFSLQEDQVQGLPVVRVVNNYTQLSEFRLLYESPFFDSVFLRLLEQVQPDVLHFQHLQHLSVRLLSLAAALGYPTILTLHDFFFACHLINLINTEGQLCAGPESGARCVSCLQNYSSPEEARQRFARLEQALRAPDLILTPSSFLAQKMLEFFPFLQKKLRVAPLGIKGVPRLTPVRAPGAPLRILYVGVFLPHKGAHVLVKALTGLPPERFEASLYGATLPAEQGYVDRLRAAARTLPIRFFNGYPHAQIGAILAQHDVLVMPMIWEETFSILTREALMAGVPVVAARRGALPEAVQDGENGLLFEPENADELRRCLCRLIENPKLVERLREPQPRIKTMAEYGRDIEAIYAEVSAQSQSSAARERRLVAQRCLSESFSQTQAQWSGEKRQLTARIAQLELDNQRMTASTHALQTAFAACERDLHERESRLNAIYTSTTWKLYQGYAAVRGKLSSRPLRKLKRWFSSL